MSQPLLNKEIIMEHLKERIPRDPIIEVSGIWPSDDAVVPYGIYVHDVEVESREVNQLAVQYCGSIYNITDGFMILYVSFQDDPQSYRTLGIIQDMASNINLFDGYFNVTYTHATEFGNRSEKHTYTFNMQRLDFNQPST
jgi:hypothetical protein